MQFAFLPFILMMSAALPYLPGGLRVEHLVIPLLAVIAALRAKRTHAEIVIGVGVLGLSLIAVAVSSRLSWETGLSADPLSQWVRLAMPMLMLSSFPYFASHLSDPAVKTSYAIIIIAIGASLFATLSFYSDLVLTILLLWVKTDEGSIWLMARAVGRITGIFNQPLEAGIFYTIALFSVVFVCKNSRPSILLSTAALIAIIGGGAVTLSKNFLILGILSGFALAIWIRLISARIAVVLCVPVFLIIPFLVIQYNVNYAEALIDLYYDGGLLSAVTAGRLGLTEFEVARLFTDVWNSEDWVLGRGAGSYLPLDNGYLEFFYQGGVLALAGYLVFLGCFVAYGYRYRRHDEGKMLFMLMMYTIGSSLGGPAISANRANVALMLSIAACIAGIRWRETLAASRPQHNANPLIANPVLA